MKEKLEQLLAEGKAKIEAVRTEPELQEVKALLLGKQGKLTELLKELPKLDVSLRPEMGKAVNQAKAQLTELLDERRNELKMKASALLPTLSTAFSIQDIMVDSESRSTHLSASVPSHVAPLALGKVVFSTMTRT